MAGPTGNEGVVASLRASAGDWAHRVAIGLERWWDRARLARRAHRPPEHLRIDTYLGHGTVDRVVVRGRLLDDLPPPPELEGEGVGGALRRSLARFASHEQPGVALRVRVGTGEAATTTDDEGYFEVEVAPGPVAPADGWLTGDVALAGPHRGVDPPPPTPVAVRLSGPDAAFGVISDVDDTIMHTGAQRAGEMIRRTLTGSALTRTPLPAAPELYQALAGGGANPVFYVSSSPWNLHDFLVAFLRRRAFPLGPLLLRDLLGDDPDRSHASTKHQAIAEVLDLHPDLRFVLVGDSGQHDPAIYAEVARRHPHRIVVVYIREVRLDPGDGRVEAVSDAWDHEVPFLLAPDSAAMADHAASLGLIPAGAAEAVRLALASPG